ncbi:uncharacterized mitochondrial protein AtMg00310-like [Malania oleifera]|uniref:uncharacterized mitochondrial protein AtMg00310-like n=1 Tax=Malania oleifera TaxID=397392 RepID=UPI0025ADA220|nr:uncharacterized mitochondrial protein AtMg00310-like [Malania oleifera]
MQDKKKQKEDNVAQEEVKDRRKIYWRSWEEICKPTSEGGLGLRDLNEVQKSLLMKYVFRLPTSNNLWAGFFTAIYCRNDHLLIRKGRLNDSWFWESIMATILEVMDNVKILVRGGNSSLWFDRWLSSDPLSISTEDILNKKLCINDCWLNDNWNSNLVLELVGADKTRKILHQVPAGKSWKDIFVWKPALDGNFSTKTA